ncbi:MAG: hypothetical protein GX804_01045 [Lentisphaerae bacterium]|jgi:hypothetical protein|nr:hypothetical protein [Lentisphaerota bacterium]
MIYVDMDDVICESGVMLARFAKLNYGRNIDVEEIFDYDLRKSFMFDEETYRHYMKSFHETELLDIPEIPGATDTIRKWREDGLNPIVVTGRPVYTNEATHQWLKNYGLEGMSVYHVDKYATLFNESDDPLITPFPALAEMNFKFAVDDAPNAIRMISEINLCPFALFCRPWNRTYELPQTPQPNYRIKSWVELDNIVRKVVGSGKPGQ